MSLNVQFLQGMEFISLYKVSICNAHKNIHIALEMIKFHFKYLLSEFFNREKLSRKTKWAHKNLKLWIIVKNQRLNGEIFVEFIFCLPPSSLLSSYVSTIIVVAAQRFFIFVNISIFFSSLAKEAFDGATMNRDRWYWLQRTGSDDDHQSVILSRECLVTYWQY